MPTISCAQTEQRGCNRILKDKKHRRSLQLAFHKSICIQDSAVSEHVSKKSDLETTFISSNGNTSVYRYADHIIILVLRS